jgi:hypothetical protein
LGASRHTRAVAGFGDGFGREQRERLWVILRPYLPTEELVGELINRVETSVELYHMSKNDEPDRRGKLQRLEAILAAALALDAGFGGDVQLELNLRGQFHHEHPEIDLNMVLEGVQSLTETAARMRAALKLGRNIPNRSLADYECAYQIATAWKECTGRSPTLTRNEDAVSGPQRSPFQRLMQEAAPLIGDSVIRGAVEHLG